MTSDIFICVVLGKQEPQNRSYNEQLKAGAGGMVSKQIAYLISR